MNSLLTFLGEKEALCCGRGWQNCTGSDPLRLFLPSSPNNIKQLLASSPPLCDCVWQQGSVQMWASALGSPVLWSIMKNCSAAGRCGEPHNTSRLQLLQMNVCVSFRHLHKCLALQNSERIWSGHSFFGGIFRRMLIVTTWNKQVGLGGGF